MKLESVSEIIPQKKSVCNDTICLNSGTCIDIGQEEFACLCKHGFHGTRCEESKCTGVGLYLLWKFFFGPNLLKIT